MTKAKQKRFASAVNEYGQQAGLLSTLALHKVVSLTDAKAVGIKDPRRIVYSLRDKGFDIDITTLRSTSLLKGSTYFSLNI